MAEAKLAPNLPDWMVKHANRYLGSGGTDGHMYKTTVPGRGEMRCRRSATTTAASPRQVNSRCITERRAAVTSSSPQREARPNTRGVSNILANPEVEVQVGTKKMNARARTTAGEERLRLWKKALEFWPPYSDYQLKTEREIPVVGCPAH